MSTILLSLLLFLLSFNPVNAFTYSSYLDISSVPINSDEENSISYESGDVKDENNKVCVPPNSEVVFVVEGIFPNTSLNSKIFLSKENVYQGDLTKILNIQLPYEGIIFQKNNITTYRDGRMYTLENITLENGKNDLLTISLKQPLKILEYTYDISNGVVNVKTVLKNDTDRLLNNVRYEHGEFSLTKNFQPSEEITYEYQLTYDENEKYVDLGYPSIYDPNTTIMCGAGTNSIGNIHTIFLIENGTIYYDTGTQEYEDFCVTQLPYTLNLERIEVGEKEVVIEEEEVHDEEEIDDENIEGNSLDEENRDSGGEELVEDSNIEEVLGISILPKTVIDIYGYIFLGIFLVAFGILCYYLTNENSIHNA